MSTTPSPSSHTRSVEEFIATSRLLLVCMLVYHHLFELPGSLHSPRNPLVDVVHFIPEFINAFFHMAAMAAVPLLSILSGYLCFAGKHDYGQLLQRRFRAVALPAWLWSALWLGFAWLLYTLPATRSLFPWADYGFATLSPLTLANGIVGITEPPFAFQFWFVRDLLLVLLCSPLIRWLLLSCGWRLLPVLGLLWILVPYPPLLFSGNVLFFFTIGAWLALPGSPGLDRPLEQLRHQRGLLLLLFSLCVLLRILPVTAAGPASLLQSHAWLCLLRLIGVLAVAALCYQLVLTRPTLTRHCMQYSGYAFFIFATHFPLIELLQYFAGQVAGHASAPGLLLSWLLLPPLTIGLCIGAACLFETELPRVFNIMNGGRSRLQDYRAASPHTFGQGLHGGKL